jgi:hypothetical protein
MGLGVEHFTSFDNHDGGKSEFAPSSDPYLIEEHIQSTEYHSSEWYRCTTLWDHRSDSPMPGYIWRMRNQKGDDRVQTDILDGENVVTTKYKPFLGHKTGGESYNPRTGEVLKLDPKVHTALTTGIEQALRMHANLGKELYSIGWDIMIRDDIPYFIEFNINNGFFLADHCIEECEQMADYFLEQFNARKKAQLLDFDPYANTKKKD